MPPCPFKEEYLNKPSAILSFKKENGGFDSLFKPLKQINLVSTTKSLAPAAQAVLPKVTSSTAIMVNAKKFLQ